MTSLLSAPHPLAGLATLGAVATLGAGFFFQHVIGLVPCELCILQRWPHVAAAALGGAWLLTGSRWLLPLAALVLLAGAGIAGYHVGVEQQWWPGPTACSAPDFSGLSPREMLEALRRAPVVRCDEIPWSLFGISMAGYNGLLSLALAGLFGRAYASSSASQYR